VKRTGLWLYITIVTSILTLWACMAWLAATSDSGPPGAVDVKVHLPGSRETVSLVHRADGSYAYLVRGVDGSHQTLSPEEFAARLYDAQSSSDLLAVVFNVSTPLGMIWIGLGLLGQLLFTGRMVVQWMASEKQRRSVVPPMFWWMSLIGSLMLLSYFLWRRDVVGILGQGIGLAIYVRNLHLIYLTRPAAVEAPLEGSAGEHQSAPGVAPAR
jgi:lipid-A-disaccharide synthase-like uncharacterized protein